MNSRASGELAPAFDHIVITRFTAVFSDGQQGPNEDWAFYRLGFFYDALVASVAAQRGAGPFTWLVFFDDRCSEDFRAEVERICEGVFVPIWTHERFWRVAPEIVEEHCSGAPYLITTRIDSDDAVAVDYFASIQAQFDGIAPLTINFPRGLQINRFGEVYQYQEPVGAFQSYVEKRQPGQLPTTVFGHPVHARAQAHAPVREVKAPPMWMQIIHGANTANSIRGLRVHPRVVAERFSISLPFTSEMSLSELALARVKSYGQRAKFWANDYYYFLEWLDASVDLARGTHTKKQNPDAMGPPIVSRFMGLRGGKGTTRPAFSGRDIQGFM